ncbi:TonB-dependent receptor [Rodentibacter pneumotropicus]|uniref:TonB-dependent receptor n=1 Tax=Rodentibacter pneumotropicus TaxID=758 RepID=UPI00037F8D8C|nr:TonB-dependent receptor [Rodentibacter pneumotropicus]NBH75069.1 TonB-dependent receptor [Rodentibacter pneumotropicus]OOF61719.1 TonB-dependent receptor [Rodentibacter pneumotropicus]THA04519.1 TonB-dependent receptor [Rodentibacter pneumotropicus]THA05600.1 TonB-dependent receptor [Rodentibacter pneumotropicus]THA14287.1 TonB-dependent receptor [Rodentibacter pneumotropicus]
MKKTFVYSALTSAVILAMNSAYADEQKVEELDVIEVSADATQTGLAKEFAGGQVASGSRAGILGNKTNLENPFATTSYTNKFIQDKQARSVADVLKNDPNIRVARGFGNFQESYFMRGFITNSDDILYNGLYGLLPRQYIASEMFERVEIQRGASAFLNGIAPSGGSIGGTIALMPKRAAMEDLNRLNIGLSSNERANVGTDISRRFGNKKEFGVRLNAAHTEGESAIDSDKARNTVFHLGLDWKGEKVRVSADLGYQKNYLGSPRPSVTLNGVDEVPAAPKATSNWGQHWTYSEERDVFGTLRAEYDFLPHFTGYVAYGFRDGKEANLLANLTVRNNNGDGTEYRFDNSRRNIIHTGEIGLKSSFETGAIGHEMVLSANRYQEKRKNAYVMDFFNTFATNLYNPRYINSISYAPNAFRGNDLSSPALTNRVVLTSFALGDTLSFLEKTLQVTLGARWQQLSSKDFAYNTGVQSAAYKEAKLSPSIGVVYRFTPEFSVYGNYIESLSQGDTAPSNAINQGQTQKPYVSKQKEIGVKYESDSGFGASLALFSTEKPRGYLDTNNFYTTKGQDRHDGAEINLYGQITDNTRLLGGVTFLHAKQRNTGSSTTDGKYTIGVPKLQGNLGLEYDVKAIEGLTLESRVTYTGSSYADPQNTLKVKDWTRVDIGARYIALLGNTPVTLRARLDNLTNKKYWESVGGYPNYGYLVSGAPRTLSVSATIDF